MAHQGWLVVLTAAVGRGGSRGGGASFFHISHGVDASAVTLSSLDDAALSRVRAATELDEGASREMARRVWVASLNHQREQEVLPTELDEGASREMARRVQFYGLPLSITRE